MSTVQSNVYFHTNSDLDVSVSEYFFFFSSLLLLLLCSPNMANTVNAALKPLETLSRIVNQPSSLFGGKGGSSKSKTEHDPVGTARDSNSNTQDQGNCVILAPQYFKWY